VDSQPGAFVWTLRVGSTGDGPATVFVRKHQYEVGAPVQFDPQYQYVTALEYVLGALAADVVNGLKSIASTRRVAIENIEGVVKGELNNPLTHLGVVGETGHSGIEKIELRVYVSSLADHAAIQTIWDETLARSPLVRTLSPLVHLTLGLKPVI
jgi:hypothetical protein